MTSIPAARITHKLRVPHPNVVLFDVRVGPQGNGGRNRGFGGKSFTEALEYYSNHTTLGFHGKRPWKKTMNDQRMEKAREV